MYSAAHLAHSTVAGTLYAAVAAMLLSGCVNNARTVYDQPTLAPGESVTCVSNPCSVYFQTPAGSGTHIVKEELIKAGEVTGGERIYLGSYWAGRTVFTVEGTDLPPAYLTVMGQE